MVTKIKLPSWRDVELPEEFAANLRGIRSEVLLEQLIHEKVFQHSRRIQYVYYCAVCGYSHKAAKATDDYGQCERCESKAIRAARNLRGWNRPAPTGCSSTDAFAQAVLFKMQENYAAYAEASHSQFPWDKVVALSCKDGGFSVQYLSGCEVCEATAAKALCKGALLVPLLWDGNYDWKSMTHKPASRQTSLFPTFNEWVHCEH